MKQGFLTGPLHYASVGRLLAMIKGLWFLSIYIFSFCNKLPTDILSNSSSFSNTIVQFICIIRTDSRIIVLGQCFPLSGPLHHPASSLSPDLWPLLPRSALLQGRKTKTHLNGQKEEGRKRNTERIAAKFQDMPKLDCNRNYCNGFIGAYESERGRMKT